MNGLIRTTASCSCCGSPSFYSSFGSFYSYAGLAKLEAPLDD